MITSQRIEAVLLRHRPAGPADEAKGRVLRASAAALLSAPSPTRIDRMWFSRRWRLGWVAAALFLVAAQWWVVGRDPAARDRPGFERARAAQSEMSLAARELGLDPSWRTQARPEPRHRRIDTGLLDW